MLAPVENSTAVDLLADTLTRLGALTEVVDAFASNAREGATYDVADLNAVCERMQLFRHHHARIWERLYELLCEQTGRELVRGN